MSEALRTMLVTAAATAGHAEWQKGWREANGDKPRIKTTKDPVWIAANNTDQVDIAALGYSALPIDWQAENKAGAESAVKPLMDAIAAGRTLDDSFVEEASALVHDLWVERNKDWAAPELKVPYAELPEVEKEKDRFFVRAAIEAYQASQAAAA